MTLKNALLFIPFLVFLGLLQSYLWVPTYEDQTTAGEGRLEKFISAISGDARLLNPIVAADSASGFVVSHVFDSLLEIDENLRLKPHLAKEYKVSCLATIVVGEGFSPESLLQKISPHLTSEASEIRVLEPSTLIRLIDPDGPGPLKEQEVKVTRPNRIEFFLDDVDPAFFEKSLKILGTEYGQEVTGISAVSVSGEISEGLISIATALAPITEIRPVIDFDLRKDVTFHDGEAFDASDVKFTYEAIMDVRNLSPRRSDFEPIESIHIRDSHSVRVIYKRPFAPAIFVWSYMGILPEHLLNSVALNKEMDARGISGTARDGFGVRASKFNRSPIGTGAFKFTDWKTDESISLARNQDYFDGPPEYKELHVRIIPDSVAREVEFKAGAVDTYLADPHQVARYLQDPAYQPFTSLGLGYTYIGYNLRREPFQDVRVRRALGMAINIDEIIDYVLYGEGQRITGPYPIQTDWYNHDVQPEAYDPGKALDLLKEAGFHKNSEGFLEKNGQELRFNLISNNGNPQRKAILTIAQNSWRKLGIRCDTRLLEWAVFLKDYVNTGDFDAVVLGWGLSELDPDLYQIWHSSQTGPQQLNFVGYKNNEVDDLIENLREEYSRTQQVEMARNLHSLIARDQPYTFLYVGRRTQVVDRKIVMVKRSVSGAVVDYEKLRPTPTGNLNYFFNRWRKLEAIPDL